MATVQVKNLTKRFDHNIAINNTSLTIEDGMFMVFLGPSGCGKTTTLRCIAGLEIPEEGQILIDGEDVTKLPPSARDIAMVFQQYAIYPHMTVAENLAFPLKAVNTPRDEIEKRVQEAAKTLRIERLLGRKPGKLSGGEMQRVAIGRAIVRRPKVFLMDEPLSNLDAKLRTEMRAEIKHLQSDLNATTIYVTHDQLEAMSMADRIAIMYGGIVQQLGTPAEVYDHPSNLFVAGFIGSPAMNFAPCRISEDRSKLLLAGGAQIALHADAKARFEPAPANKELILGVRPEDLALRRDPQPEFDPVEVYVVEPLGAENIFTVNLKGDPFKVRTLPTFLAKSGDTLYMRIDQSRSHLFDAETTLSLTE
ncbi:MAG TPA: ABC transporter ATP-binding protein [Chthonomonadaceae bacterium]|nr:ABC transporter ATP-binding protein [Chthonomonadaceae bacterium]